MRRVQSNIKNLLLSTALRSVAFTAAAVFASSTMMVNVAQAQETTAGLSGKVLSEDGSAASGVTVRVVHAPSGTVKTMITNADGAFSMRNLRVGGPYTITVVSDGGNARITDVHLGIGGSSKVSLVLESTDIEEIVVTGTRSVNSVDMGSSTSIGADAIEGVPAVSRELYDIVNINPMVSVNPDNQNAISIGGANNRFNSVTIDGVKQNDEFGLNGGGFPTQRSPISLDVIERLDINIAPFDAAYNGFLGGNINIVTKSGENEFHGSAFFQYRDAGLSGAKLEIDGVAKDIKLDFTEKSYGGTFSGPIIEDKLFFMVGLEWLNSTKPIDTGAESSGYANEVLGIMVAGLEQIKKIAKDKYGFDAGSFSNLKDIGEDDRKFFAKIDLNINEAHRAAFTFQYNNGNTLKPQHTNANFKQIGMPSHWYDHEQTMKSYSLGLYSDWSDNFTTDLRVSYKQVDSNVKPLGGNGFAQMRIKHNGSSIYLGPDQYRHANKLTTDTWNVKLNGSYYLGDHEISGGMEFDRLDVFNLFVFASNGAYTFDSIADFEAKTAASLFYNNAYTNNAEDGAAAFKLNVTSFYLQDRWTVSDDLTVMFGGRFEVYSTSDAPKENTNFMARNGFTNNATLDGRSIFLPRMGFNYQVSDDTKITGGIGKFSGGSPNVWVSNTYTNDGVTIVNKFFRGPITNVDGLTIKAAHKAALVKGDGGANYLDPNFKIPSAWKFNLAVSHDYEMGEDGQYNISAEVLYTKQKNAATWIDAGLEVKGTAQDGRNIYGPKAGGKTDLGVTNADGGNSLVLAAKFSAKYDNGVSLSLAYTYVDSNDVNPGTSSTATSNYGKFATADIQHSLAATSNYEVTHRIVARAAYRTELFDDLESRFSLLFFAQSGRPFSYTFFGDGRSPRFGDSQAKRHRQLFYVPNNAAEVGLNSVDWANLNKIIEASGLDAYRGKIAPRNAFNDPWYSRLDIKFTQEIPGILEDHKGRLELTVQNVGNLINSKWGHRKSTSFHYVKPIAKIAVDGAGKYTYSSITKPRDASIRTLSSLWKIRIGVRYKF
jgi:outer membrane receptor for ferrienterochelin and colicin